MDSLLDPCAQFDPRCLDSGRPCRPWTRLHVSRSPPAHPQTKEVFIKRYAFLDSIEAATAELHTKIKTGEIKTRDGVFPPEVIRQQ